MYCEFFELNALPFNNTPDPRFFFNSPDHEEALASLLYAAEERKGFVLVTGEVGSGKTLLSRLLLGKLGPTERTAIISNTRLTGRQLLVALCREFDLDIDDDVSVPELTHVLEDFLLEQYARDRLVVVVLDEAQNLPLEAFEEVRMLGNLEADDAKLLQLLILGQPELQDAFRDPALRQLHQRMFRTFHLNALTRELTEGYIKHRLRIAGLPDGETIFDAAAFEAIYHHSEGIPRLINQICDNAMLAAYTESSKTVAAAIIDEVVEQMMALTAGSVASAPRGPLAKRFVGEPPVEKPDATAAPQSTGLDPTTHHMMCRLDAMERTVVDIHQDGAVSNKKEDDADAELDAVRQIRRQTAALMQRVAANSQDAEHRVQEMLDAARQSSERLQGQTRKIIENTNFSTNEAGDEIRELLANAKRSSEQVQRQAAETLRETQRQNAEQQEQVRGVLEELRRSAGSHHSKTSEMVRQEHQELQAVAQMREQAAEMLKQVTTTSEQANERLIAMLDNASHASVALDEKAEQVLNETQEKNASLQVDVEKRMGDLLNMVNATAKQIQQRASETLEQTDEKNASLQVDVEKRMGDLLDMVNATAKQIQQRASETLEQTDEKNAAIHTKAQKRVNGLVEKVDATAKQIDERAKETLDETEKRNAVLHAQAEHMLEEVRAYANGQQECISELMSKERAELNAAQKMRRRAVDMLAKVEAEAGKSNQHLAKIVDEAGQAADAVETQASRTLTDTEAQHAAIRAQADQFLEELKAQTEAQRAATNETCKQQQQQVTAVSKQVSELAAHMKKRTEEVDRKSGEVLELVEARVKEMSSRIDAIGNVGKTRADELRKSLDEFMAEMRQRVEGSHKQLLDVVSNAQSDVESSRRSLGNAREQIIAETDARRTKADEILGQTNDLLLKTREQTASLLTNLRAQITEKTENAERIWKTAAGQGSKSLSDLQARLDETRLLTDRSRTELESLILRATDQLANTRKTFESSLGDHSTEVAALSTEAAKIKAGITQRFQEAKKDLDAVIEKNQQSIRQRVIKLVGETDGVLSSAETRAQKTIEGLQSELGAAAKAAERIYADLQRSVESSLGDHRTDVAALSAEAADIKAGITQRFQEAKKELGAVIEKNQQSIRQRVVELVGETDGVLSSAETRAQKTIEGLQSELGATAKAAERIYTDLQQSVDVLQQKAAEHQQRYNDEAHRAQGELTELTDKCRDLLTETQDRVEEMTHQADDTAETLSHKIDEFRQAAKIGVTNIGQELETCLAGAIENAERIRNESQAVATELTDRMNLTRQQAETAITNAEDAVVTIREQSKASLADVRSGLVQMNKRAQLFQRDLVGIGDEVGQSAANSIEQLRQTATIVVSQIEGLREGAQQDADANCRRLTALRQQVEEGAEQIRHNATKLLDQVQQGASSLRDHANELLAQTQTGSDKIGEQAANLLMQAHSTAESFREQAEALLRRAEANAETIRTDAQALRSDLLNDCEGIRKQIQASQKEVVQARQDSAQARDEARNIHDDARRQAEDIQRTTQDHAQTVLDRADQVSEHAQELLRVPKDIIDQAGRHAKSLDTVSKKVSGIIKDLTVANQNAERNRSDLHGANTTADEKLDLLKHHTTRVGQLVGIIRQLYGSMDARIENLRSRLGQADELFRTVPTQIENLRHALGVEHEPQQQAARATAPNKAPPASAMAPKPHKKATPAKAKAPTTQPAPAQKDAPSQRKTGSRRAGSLATVATEKGSLGELVQRNQKLNEWLRDVLDEEQQKGTAPRRATNPKRRETPVSTGDQ